MFNKFLVLILISAPVMAQNVRVQQSDGSDKFVTLSSGITITAAGAATVASAPWSALTSVPANVTNAVPNTITVNGHALSGNVTVTPTDLSLVIGTNTQAYNATLGIIAANSGTVASSGLTFSSPTLTAPVLGTIASGVGTTLTALNGSNIGSGTVAGSYMSAINVAVSGNGGITGTQTISNGGTGNAALTAYAPLFGGTTTTAAIQSGTVGTTGQVLTSNGAGAIPTFQSASVGSIVPSLAHADATGITQVSFPYTITSYTPAGAGTFRTGGYVTVTADSTTTLELETTWTDETSTARTSINRPVGSTTSTFSVAGQYVFPTMDIRVKASTLISVIVLSTGGVSATVDAGGTIQQLQ